MATGAIKIIEQLSPIVTKTSGNSVVQEFLAFRSGHIVQITFTFQNSGGKTTAGTDSFFGTVTGIPIPNDSVMGNAYYGSSILIPRLTKNGEFNIRVTGADLAQQTARTLIAEVSYILPINSKSKWMMTRYGWTLIVE